MSRESSYLSNTDEDSIPFEVRDGMRRIRCVVSNDALEGVSGLPSPSTAILRRRSFDRFRTLINAAAALKISGLAAGTTGEIRLTREDLRSVPQQNGMPLFGSTKGWAQKEPSAGTAS